MKYESYQPTYKDLKPGLLQGLQPVQLGYQPTYKDLKPTNTISGFNPFAVTSLPIRT